MAYDGRLEPDAGALTALVEAATRRVVAHLESLPRLPLSHVEGAEALARSLREPFPEHGRPVEELLDIVFERVLSRSYNTASPGYLAYIPGGGLPESAVASMIAASVNRYASVWVAAPGLAEIESNVVRWFCRVVGYPESAFGILTSGGSLANLSGIATAREERLGEDLRDAVLYVSDQAHHSVAKSARLCGLPRRALSVLPGDAGHRLDPGRLDRAIRDDRAAGRRPFLVVASAGTTNSGVIDDLPALAGVARRHGLWFHVDAAYGGFFALTERGAAALRGIETADSIVLDPHKGLFLPYGTGCLLVRDREALRRAHAERADYMPTIQEPGEHADFCELSPELSRPWRGLHAWLPIARHGFSTFRDCLDEKLDLAREAAREVAALPGLVIVSPPTLSLFAFRYVGDGSLSGDEQDAANRRLLEAVNARQRVFLTATTLDGRYTPRLCVLSFRTRAARMRMAMEDLRAALDEIRTSGRPAP